MLIPLAACIAITAFVSFITYLIAHNGARGKQMYATNELPYRNFEVVFFDETSLLIEAVEPQKRRFLITIEAFQKGNLKIGMILIKKGFSRKELKELGYKELGYPSLVSVC